MRICIALLLCLSTQAATYYIAAGGYDSNNGTDKSTPWANAPFMPGCASNCAAYSHAAGDRIILKGGDTWTITSLMSTSNSGSAGNSDYYGVDKTWYTGGSWTNPIIDGGGTYSQVSTAYLTFMGNYITLDGWKIQNLNVSGTSTDGHAIATFGHDILIENMVMPVETRNALYLVNSSGTTLSNITVANNDISNCSWGVVVAIAAANSTTDTVNIYGNKIHDFHSQFGSGRHGDGIFVFTDENTADREVVSNLNIYNNLFYGDFSVLPSTSANGMTAFIYCQDCWGSVNIFNNAIYPTAQSGGYGIKSGTMDTSLFGPASNWLVANNSGNAASSAQGFIGVNGINNLTSYNNINTGGTIEYDIGLTLSRPITTFASDYNLFYGWSGAFAWNQNYSAFKTAVGSVASISIVAPGTGYNTGDVIAVGTESASGYGQGMRATVTASGGVVTGLNLTNGGFGYTGWPHSTVNVSGSGSGLTVNFTVPNPSGYESHGLNSDPLFTSSSDLRLQSGSPARTVGTNLTSLGITALNSDAAGVARPSSGAWSIGAYEYVTGSVMFGTFRGTAE